MEIENHTTTTENKKTETKNSVNSVNSVSIQKNQQFTQHTQQFHDLHTLDIGRHAADIGKGHFSSTKSINTNLTDLLTFDPKKNRKKKKRKQKN